MPFRFTIKTMNDSPSVNVASGKSTGTGSVNSQTSTSSASKAASFDQTFQQLLATLLIGMTLPGMTNQTASNQSSGINSLMAPLMLGLLERLLENQVETEGSPTQTTSPATQSLRTLPGVVLPMASSTTPAETQSKSIDPASTPTGRPAQGPITQGSHAGHIALDIGIPVGTEVHATMDGKVIYAGWNNEGYGNLVIVENGPYKTYYAHLSKIPVKVGDLVKAKDMIGLSGNTGNSTGPHLHYEVRRNNVAIDPTSFTLN